MSPLDIERSIVFLKLHQRHLTDCSNFAFRTVGHAIQYLENQLQGYFANEENIEL